MISVPFFFYYRGIYTERSLIIQHIFLLSLPFNYVSLIFFWFKITRISRYLRMLDFSNKGTRFKLLIIFISISRFLIFLSLMMKKPSISVKFGFIHLFFFFRLAFNWQLFFDIFIGEIFLMLNFRKMRFFRID